MSHTSQLPTMQTLVPNHGQPSQYNFSGSSASHEIGRILVRADCTQNKLCPSNRTAVEEGNFSPIKPHHTQQRQTPMGQPTASQPHRASRPPPTPPHYRSATEVPTANTLTTHTAGQQPIHAQVTSTSNSRAPHAPAATAPPPQLSHSPRSIAPAIMQANEGTRSDQGALLCSHGTLSAYSPWSP